MFWVVKIIFTLFLISSFLIPANAETKNKTLTFLIIGQSISSNCNQKKFDPEFGVNQFNIDGNIVKAQDPLIWADCQGGSLWIPFGKKIITDNLATEVNLLPIGARGTKIKDWLPSGRAYPKLQKALDLIINNKIHIDYVLFYQGSSDIGTKPYLYHSMFLQLHKIVKNRIGFLDWIIATHSRCFGRTDKDIANIQKSFNSIHFYTGPDSNSFGDEYRFDGCHLNEQGQLKMAMLWADSVKNAIDKKKDIENETLISYFKHIKL